MHPLFPSPLPTQLPHCPSATLQMALASDTDGEEAPERTNCTKEEPPLGNFISILFPVSLNGCCCSSGCGAAAHI